MPLEIRPIPLSPLGEIWAERVQDWADEAPHFIQLYMDYREQYYKKICSKCSHAQQVKRKCAALSPYHDEKSCRHLDRAFAAKYRKQIDQRYASHPFMQRIRWNLELEERRNKSANAATDDTAAKTGCPTRCG